MERNFIFNSSCDLWIKMLDWFNVHWASENHQLCTVNREDFFRMLLQKWSNFIHIVKQDKALLFTALV